MVSKKLFWIVSLVLIFSLACSTTGMLSSGGSEMNESQDAVEPQDVPPPVASAPPQPVPQETPTLEPVLEPEPEEEQPLALPPAPEGPFGPQSYPPGINPLTGLPVNDPANLLLPPALISITNWPPAARPAAGLSFSPFVFELYIGEGMSRFLGLFYGSYPQVTDPQNAGNSLVGPIRSGRLPYESLRNLYNGFLVMSSAYSGVAANLSQFSNIYGSDADDINSAMIPVDRIEQIAQNNQRRLGENSLQANLYDETVQPGGQPANRLWFIYNQINQVVWQYDPEIEAYRRYQDNADGKTFIQATDRVNGEGLTYENVILLFAQHRACNEVAFDIDLQYIPRAPAILFRDGQVYPIYWTTKSEEYERTTGKLRPIRFIDQNGNPVALKPGQTWVHLMPLGSTYWESPDRQEVPLNDAQWVAADPAGMLYNLLNNKEAGSANWVTRYYASLITYDQTVCEKLR
jgi:hypothetical protein